MLYHRCLSNGPSAPLALRLILLGLLAGCKLVLLRPQMQMYLNVGYERAATLFTPDEAVEDNSASKQDNSSSKQLRTARKRNVKKAAPKTGKISAGTVQSTVWGRLRRVCYHSLTLLRVGRQHLALLGCCYAATAVANSVIRSAGLERGAQVGQHLD